MQVSVGKISIGEILKEVEGRGTVITLENGGVEVNPAISGESVKVNNSEQQDYNSRC